MTIHHLVAFKTSNPSHLPALTKAFLNLANTCQRDGRPYILNVSGGKQISPEGKHGGVQVLFVVEFENQDDTDYYLFKDPAHDAFKEEVAAYELEDVVVYDWIPGQF